MAGPEERPAQQPLRPELRNLLVERTSQDGREGVALSDPLGIAAGPIFVPDGLLPIVGRFDGSRTVAELEAELTAATSQQLPPDLVAGMARQMDELLLLDGDRFRAALARTTAEFVGRSARPSVHAGATAGYPAEAQALGEALDTMIRRPSGAPRPTPSGLVAPHIDLARGREGYALAYSALAECEPADLYVLFGTGHQGPLAPVTGLPLDWETPLGTVTTDRAFVAAIHARIGAAHPTDVLLHRNEHSLEFQMLFLRHVLGDRNFQVAGFLTGPLMNGHGPVDQEPHVRLLLDAFTIECAKVRAAGRRVCFIAGADLAHIGPLFGDPTPIDTARLDRLTADELPRLRHLEDGDPAAFYAAVEHTGNPDRICGTTPMFLTAALAGGAGRLLHYGQATTADGHQTVSYCGMLFE